MGWVEDVGTIFAPLTHAMLYSCGFQTEVTESLVYYRKVLGVGSSNGRLFFILTFTGDLSTGIRMLMDAIFASVVDPVDVPFVLTVQRYKDRTFAEVDWSLMHTILGESFFRIAFHDLSLDLGIDLDSVSVGTKELPFFVEKEAQNSVDFEVEWSDDVHYSNVQSIHFKVHVPLSQRRAMNSTFESTITTYGVFSAGTDEFQMEVFLGVCCLVMGLFLAVTCFVVCGLVLRNVYRKRKKSKASTTENDVAFNQPVPITSSKNIEGISI